MAGSGRAWRAGAAAVTAATVAVSTAPPASARVEAPLPTSIAALGDSITRGFNACGFYSDCASRSWSTGDHGRVDSHRLRLKELGAKLTAQHNYAQNGARAESLAAQAARAVEAKAQYVTVEIGANDACRSAESRMTPVEEFRGHVDAGLAVLAEGTPQVRVFVASIPDVHRLWETAHVRRAARWTWDRLDICQSLLARPNSAAPADVARRDRVRDRVKAYNAALEVACKAFDGSCRYDGGAVFETRFGLDEVSHWDWFHPSTKGQRTLAAVTWKAGFRW